MTSVLTQQTADAVRTVLSSRTRAVGFASLLREVRRIVPLAMYWNLQDALAFLIQGREAQQGDDGHTHYQGYRLTGPVAPPVESLEPPPWAQRTTLFDNAAQRGRRNAYGNPIATRHPGGPGV